MRVRCLINYTINDKYKITQSFYNDEVDGDMKNMVDKIFILNKNKDIVIESIELKENASETPINFEEKIILANEEPLKSILIPFFSYFMIKLKKYWIRILSIPKIPYFCSK